MFTEQLPDLLDYVNSLTGLVCLVGDMNIHFDYPLQSLTKQTLSTLCLYGLVQVINKPTHRCGHIIDWVIVRPDDDIHRKSTVTDSLESDHYCTKSFFNISVSKPSTLYRTVRNIANIDRPSFIAELSSVSEFSSVENANQFCDFLRTVLDKHAPPSLRKVITHSSSPWFESIRDELFIAKRERRQAERKWRNTKLAIFKDLYGQAKHKVSIFVHTAKCKFYTERIALASSSKELHQIVNTLSNRHPPKILPTIYPSADLPSIFIKHFTNKAEILRANIASEHVTSTLVTGTTAATFSSFEKVSQLTVKECILNSAPKSCELDPIPSKLLIECLQMSAPPDRISELLHSMQSCISDVKALATANMLKLNDSKTELMLVTSKRSKHLHNLPTSITIGNAQIPFKQSVKNLGFTLDCHLTMNAHVSNIARTCYFELRRLASIRRFLTSTATATLVSAFVLSRIDYCNSLLFGSTNDVTSHLQRIQNYAARVIFRLSMSSSITIHLKSLHWLPVKVRSTYKIACLCYHCHSSAAPSYVTDMLHKKPFHTHNTRSSSYTVPLLNRPAHSKATLGDRSFSFASSSVWNFIPNDVWCAPSLSSFKSRLKTYLFRSVYID